MNVETRDQRLVTTHKNNNPTNCMNKSSSSNAVYQTRSRQKDLIYNQSNTYLTTGTQQEYYQTASYYNDDFCDDRSVQAIREKRKNRTSALTLRLRDNPGNYNHRNKSSLNLSTVSNGNQTGQKSSFFELTKNHLFFVLRNQQNFKEHS